ncbi:hypothetical protein SAMN06296952_0192 [Oscillospiraceae bacterium]|nr:hypothetical protein SAMN06296952_0192 [Oscillospiraceae bacterium]
MYDLKINLKRSVLLFLSLMFLGTLVLFAIIGGFISTPILMFPILLAVLSIAGIILCFVPFFKDHMWLIPIADVLIGAIVAVIIHFI